MSRRPSSQGRSKPEVKSNPPRPQTTAPKQNKRLDTLTADEEEYKRLNEELNKEFPEISEQYEALMDPSNPLSIEDLVKKMGNISGPINPVSNEEINETFNRVVPESRRGKETISNLPQTNDPSETIDVFSSLQDRGIEYMKMNDELNKKNSSFMEECKALLTKLNPGKEQDLEQEDETRSDPIFNSTDIDALMAREKECRKMDEELDKKNVKITKKAEALLAKQRQKEKTPTPKVSDKKPPQMNKSVRTRSIVDRPPIQSGTIANPNVAAALTDSDDSLDALREEIMSGTEFTDVIRRIEERVMKINGNPDQPPADNQSADTANALVPQQSELGACSVAEEPRGNTLPLARPFTAPAPIPEKRIGARVIDPIRDIEPPDEVGSEAIQRFLKAKLNVLKEELDRASEEIARKDAELQECKKELISKQEQDIQLNKQVTSLRSQADKQQKKLDLVTNELDNSKLEVRLATIPGKLL